MLPFWALFAAPAWAAPKPKTVRVAVTYYAMVAERDFGDKATEPVEWHLLDSASSHVSLFAPGFTSRDADDPKRPGLAGVAMEGAGLIDIALHQGDAALTAAWKKGYRVLTLETWDERRQKATFALARRPKTSTGDAVEGVSAAVRRGDRLFPMGSEVEVLCPGQAPERRTVDDTCSSCRSDAHLDLYVSPDRVRDGIFRCRARLLKLNPSSL